MKCKLWSVHVGSIGDFAGGEHCGERRFSSGTKRLRRSGCFGPSTQKATTMPSAVSRMARLANLSVFAFEHVSFRLSRASQEERREFWSRALCLGGLVGDTAATLAGAMVVLDFLSLDEASDGDQLRTEIPLGMSHRLASSASGQFAVAFDEQLDELRSIDVQGAKNLLRFLPSTRIPKDLVSELLEGHVRLSSHESHSPYPDTERDDETFDSAITLHLPQTLPADAEVVGGPQALLVGTLGGEAIDAIARTWMALLGSGVVNPSLLPNGVVAIDRRLYAPIGWNAMIRVPDTLQQLTNRLITLTAARSIDLDDAVKGVLEYIGVSADQSLTITDRLIEFSPEADWLAKASSPTTGHPAGMVVPEDNQATTGVLLLAQFCFLLAARRGVTRLPAEFREPTASPDDSSGGQGCW